MRRRPRSTARTSACTSTRRATAGSSSATRSRSTSKARSSRSRSKPQPPAPEAGYATIRVVLGAARSADGISIAYEVLGAATPALVFVHGWSCDRTYWRHQLPHFAERHVVVAVDLAGHGDSQAGRAEYTMPAYGQDVAAVANQLGLEEIVLVGHSMGGDVNVEAALELGPRVVAQVWVDVYFHLEQQDHDDVEETLAPLRRDF